MCSGALALSGKKKTRVGVQLRRFHAQTASYSSVGPEHPATLEGDTGPRAVGVSFTGCTRMGPNDRLEVWVANRSGAADITVQSGTFHVFGR